MTEFFCKAPELKFYDTTQDATAESDASLSGLGATLLQQGEGERVSHLHLLVGH